MKIDFTLKIYIKLLEAFRAQNYQFLTLEQYLIDHPSVTTQPITDHASRITHHASLILRHDVDRKPRNALKMAQIEHELGIRASYYFRIVKQSNHPAIIERIATLGHEIGYHYEDLALSKGDYKMAIKTFEENLSYFRKLYPVKTICMHGSPLSKWDNRKLWDYYDYRNFGIIAEPYFDLNFNDIFYITDAGRSWNNQKTSIRDRVDTQYKIPIHSTKDIIALVTSGKSPAKIMLNIHPHNWSDHSLEWFKTLVWQGTKNKIKNLTKLKFKKA